MMSHCAYGDEVPHGPCWRRSGRLSKQERDIEPRKRAAFPALSFCFPRGRAAWVQRGGGRRNSLLTFEKI